MTAPPPATHTATEAALQARVAELTELLGQLCLRDDATRRQLARQLHDNLGSSMTALTMHLSLLAQHLPEGKARDRAAQMKQLLHGIIEANRAMQLSLWNDKLEFLGVKTALHELVASCNTARAGAVQASLPDEEVHCAPELGVTVLRVAEEGLRTLDGGVAPARLILDDDGDQLMLTLHAHGAVPWLNDGHASDGLRLLRERAHFLHGSLTRSAGDDGAVVLTLLLPHAPARSA